MRELGRGAVLSLALMPALLGQAHDQPRTPRGAAGAAPATTTAGVSPAVGAALRFDVPADHPERWAVVLTGVEARALSSEVFAVYAVPGASAGRDVAGLPPMAGRYEVEGTSVRFVPRFAPAAGVTYVARATARPDVVEARFTLPSAAAEAMPPTTSVAAIYPTSDRVPANLLKLYIEFSAPMSDGEAEKRLHLLDADGREVPGAFLHVDEELWDASRRRLTVLFDPGRVKRGLRANVEHGAPLVAGRTYRVVVDSEWRDGRGRPLTSRVEKRLIVGQPDRASPNWRRWDVEAPIAATTTPLVVRFDEPLDRALLDRWLVVTDANGNRLDGTVTIGPHESSWSFVPAKPWSGTGHRLLVDPRLEDRAANSLHALFDKDLDAPQRDAHDSRESHASAGDAGKDDEPIALPFTPLRAPAHGT